MNSRGIYVLILIAASIAGKAQNPIIQTIFTADPAPLVHNDTLFLYTTHDEDSSTWFTMKDWRVFSTTDMVNWTHYDVALSLDDFPWADKDAWAAQCIYRNGKFYFYICAHHKEKKQMAIGVAVSDKATGPFKPVSDQPFISANWGDIDPTVFIDDDGQAYLYWGNPDLWYVKLNEDMISYDESVGVVRVPLTHEAFGVRKGDDRRNTQYEEGPWLYKRDQTYYMLYPAGGVPEHLAYSTGPSATGPWTYQDTIMHIIKDKGAFTNHPGLVDYKGSTYLFYHNTGLPGGGGFNRSVCVDELKFNADGSIPVIQPTWQGVGPVGSLDASGWVEAETIAWEEGLETASDGDQLYITDAHKGDYVKVRAVDFGEGRKSIVLNVASPTGGKIHVYKGSMTGEPLLTVDVDNTGGATTWKNVEASFKKIRGVHDLYFVFDLEAGQTLNLNKWKLK